LTIVKDTCKDVMLGQTVFVHPFVCRVWMLAKVVSKCISTCKEVRISVGVYVYMWCVCVCACVTPSVWVRVCVHIRSYMRNKTEVKAWRVSGVQARKSQRWSARNLSPQPNLLSHKFAVCFRSLPSVQSIEIGKIWTLQLCEISSVHMPP